MSCANLEILILNVGFAVAVSLVVEGTAFETAAASGLAFSVEYLYKQYYANKKINYEPFEDFPFEAAFFERELVCSIFFLRSENLRDTRKARENKRLSNSTFIFDASLNVTLETWESIRNLIRILILSELGARTTELDADQ